MPMALFLSQHLAASSGTGSSDFEQLEQILDAIPQVKYICLDVANGYSEHFVEFVKDVRKRFPEHTIMVRRRGPEAGPFLSFLHSSLPLHFVTVHLSSSSSLLCCVMIFLVHLIMSLGDHPWLHALNVCLLARAVFSDP